VSKEMKVRIAPENVEVLKEKYGLSDEALKAVMGDIEVVGPVEGNALPATLPPEGGLGEMQTLRALTRGEITMGEALLYMDIMDRKERKERRDEREEEGRNHPALTAEDIGKHVGVHVHSALKEVGLMSKPVTPKEEMPDWAKDIQKQQDEILGRMKKDEEDKRLGEAIDKHVGPVRTELEKAQEKIKELSSRPTEPSTGRKGMLDEYIETRNKLKEAGLLKEEPAGSLYMLGPDGKPMQGLPVKGELPAWMVYGPYFIDQMGEAVEKRMDKIAHKYGLVGPPEAPSGKPKELIPLPPKPPPEVPTEAPPAVPPEIPEEPLFELPERPAAPTPPEEAEEAPKPCAQCGKLVPLNPNGLCEACVKQLAAEPVCSRCGSAVTEIQTKRGPRYRCSKCKKFVSTKKA